MPSGSRADVEPRLSRRNWVTLVVLTLSTFIVLLDSSVVFIALPAITADLDASLDEATWVVSAFILAFAVLLLVFGKVGDMYGRRRLFTTGIAVFTLASLAAALAPSIGVLLAARVGQGIGAAMVEPTVLAIIKATFPASRLGLAFGVQGIAAVLGVVVGPTLGGVIVTALSWEYIFLINVPVGIVAIAAALVLVPESRAERAPGRVDLPGAALSAVGIAALVFAIVEGPRFGWTSPPILASFAAALVLLGAFLGVQRRTPEPLLDLRLFRDRLFAVGNGLRAAIQFVTLGIYFPLALFLQGVTGYSALQTGLALLPLVLASMITSPLAGAASDRIDVRWLVTPGMLLVAGGAVWLGQLTQDAGWVFLVGPLVVTGLGLGALEAPSTSVTLRDVPAATSGVAASITYTTLLLGAELGVTVVGAMLQSRFASNLQDGLAAAGATPEQLQRTVSALADDGVRFGVSDGASREGALSDVIARAFTDAVGAAFLVCMAVAVLAAVGGLFFTRSRAAGIDT